MIEPPTTHSAYSGFLCLTTESYDYVAIKDGMEELKEQLWNYMYGH